MIQRAALADLPAMLAISDAAGAERLSDPRGMTGALLRRLIEDDAAWVWQAVGEPVAGFAAIDGAAGAIVALLVASGHQGRGIGRALLAAACDALRAASHTTVTIALEPGAAAEAHYRAAGWTAAESCANDQLIFRRTL